MRRSQKETAQTRETIVSVASDLIRREGLSEASIANVMAAAGLTHGGFYRHFQSRNQMLTEAVAHAGENSLGKIRQQLRAGGRSKAVASYLSNGRSGAATPVCPLATTGSELCRASAETRSAATKVVTAFIDAFAQMENHDDRKARQKAMADVATMVGALTLSRLASDAELSEEILASALNRLAE